MQEEDILKMQNNNDKLFVLLFLYKRNIKIPLEKTDIDVAVYGKNFNSSLFILFELLKLLKSDIFN
jgi:hypothetical protein